MNRHHLEARLVELGAAVKFPMWSSEAYAGSKMFERMIEGVGGGGVPGGRTPTGVSILPSRVAEIARAVLERLGADEQHAVFVMYCSDRRTRGQQAEALGIKPAALRAKRRRIFVKLIDWFSPAGRALRAVARPVEDEAARARAAAEEAAREHAERKRQAKRIAERVKEGLPAFGLRLGRKHLEAATSRPAGKAPAGRPRRRA